MPFTNLCQVGSSGCCMYSELMKDIEGRAAWPEFNKTSK